MGISDDLLAADRQLYPTGRAFWMPKDGNMEKLHLALNVNQEQFYRDSLTLLSGLLPDNPQFTEDDATNWERIYGLTNNSNLTLDQRMDALYQRMSSTGNQARQHYQYIESELQKAGFNIYVFENIFPDGMGGFETKNPLTLSSGIGATDFQFGDFQFGDQQYGSFYGNIIANNIDPIKDLSFNIGENLRSTFFIGANPVGSFAYIDAARENEFRQLVLKIKPVQTVAFLFINYI